MSRITIDWSEHEAKYEFIIDDGVVSFIFTLKKPNIIAESVFFTNVQGKLLITGNFKTWVFCRPFEPAPKQCVSDMYWCEKLFIANHHMQYKYFDNDYTKERILNEGPERIISYRYTEYDEKDLKNMAKLIENEACNPHWSLGRETFDEYGLGRYIEHKKEVEYFAKCYAAAEDEYDYIEEVRNYPETMDFEDIIGKKIDHFLLCVFDAFDELCRSMEK